MPRTNRNPMVRLLGALALAAMCALPAVAQTGGMKQTLLVFPLDRSENIDPDLAEVVSAGLRNRIEKSGRYEYMAYNTRSALVQRAIQSGSVSRDDSDGPFEGGVGASIARALGLDLALTGSVEDVSLDPATNTANVTVTAQLVQSRDGRPIQTSSASGTASEKGIASDALIRRAADSAAEKIATQMFGAGATVVTPVKPSPGTVQPGAAPGAPAGLPKDGIPTETKARRKSNSLLVVGGLALVGLIIAAAGGGGGGGGGNGGGTGGPPPIPL